MSLWDALGLGGMAIAYGVAPTATLPTKQEIAERVTPLMTPCARCGSPHLFLAGCPHCGDPLKVLERRVEQLEQLVAEQADRIKALEPCTGTALGTHFFDDEKSGVCRFCKVPEPKPPKREEARETP